MIEAERPRSRRPCHRPPMRTKITSDAACEVPGVPTRAVPLWMTDEQTTAQMVADALSLAGVA